MSKLYVRNLPADATETTLRQLFQNHKLKCSTVLVKRGGYAFVEFLDQSVADQAIDKLNGYSFQGSLLVIEPSVAGGGAEYTGEQFSEGWSDGKLVVSNLPGDLCLKDVELLMMPFGNVEQLEKVDTSSDGTIFSVYVAYDTYEEAQRAVQVLDGYEIKGRSLRADLIAERGMLRNDDWQVEYSLRMLVESDMVGAIIGRQGSTVKQIAQQTHTRVNVHRQEDGGYQEKAITIYGSPENCTNACRRILEVMQQEATNNNKEPVSLRIVAQNDVVGQLIGKCGKKIKKLMKDTDTKICVSSINETNSFNEERIIIVKGSIENMSKAEAVISAKVTEIIEQSASNNVPKNDVPRYASHFNEENWTGFSWHQFRRWAERFSPQPVPADVPKKCPVICERVPKKWPFEM